MENAFNFDKDYVLAFLKDILQTDSPSGYTGAVMEKIGRYTAGLGYAFSQTRKGGGVITLPGRANGGGRGLCAHVDTLGLMVRSVKSDGTLAVTKIGDPLIPTLDGEYCTVYTRDGKAAYSGTILSNHPAAHVYREASSAPRETDTIHIRLDQKAKNEADVKNLGVGAGDFICIDPKTVITENGFIKSRFLDDKLSVGLLFGVMRYLSVNNLQPAEDTYIFISAYEEVGHGMSALPCPVTELVAVDMGCIGEDLSCSEYDVSICVKDSSGPYDFELTNRLIRLASENKINYAVDIYPYYGSDVGAALSAGYDIKGALIGPGVHASHGMERSHYDALESAMKLAALYIL